VVQSQVGPHTFINKPPKVNNLYSTGGPEIFYIDNHYGRHRFDINFFTFGQLNLGEILRDWLLNELARPHNVDLVLDCLDA
jgi:hypothetical protein